ncbi:TlpA disulfide reductase family protein [Winogradskyella sp.]|uniref:TlpA family protein disulfide reductase n=1 Tax=Winogradskyella sp. TaxID=1883156 RepID=UPI00262C43FD|nr:TlpA disulfide reductase family protein [Winogradskyella sp.]
MESWLQPITDNASFVDSYGNIVLGILLVLVLITDRLLSKKTAKTLFTKISRWMLTILVFIIVGLFYCINVPFRPMIKTLVSVEKTIGKPISDVSFIDVKTNEIKRLSSIDSELIIINFWGTFCPPCIKELPDLKKVEDKYANKLKVIALSNESPETIKRFIENRIVPSTIGSIIDKDWMNPEEFLPMSIFIKNNQVVNKHFGLMTFEDIETLCCKD